MAKTNIAIAKSALFPTISAGFDIGSSIYSTDLLISQNQQLDNNFSYNISLNVTIPIFNQ